MKRGLVRGSQQMLRYAQNFSIQDSNLTNVAGNAIINHYKSPTERPGLKRLLDNIAQGAFHNSAERGDPPRCHPHTREAIRAEIMEWITAPPVMRKLILWMHGPAGSGKSAIAQSIAEECERLGLLAASFFFWRSGAGRNDAFRFVTTIAYQLSRCIPQIRNYLFTAIEQDPTIFSRSLSTQMRVLVIEPLKLVALSLLTPIFVIVDGVDECGTDGRLHFNLLRLLGEVASELQHIPLIFLLASRPEYEIREAFDGNLLHPMTKVLVLDDSYNPDEDIKHYFNFTFHKISQKHRRLGSRLPLEWPDQSDIDVLVSKASGQFIFAATVIKFIDSPRHNPADRLDVVLRLSTLENETPFALLDAIYHFVLDSVVDKEKVLDILALLLLGSAYGFKLTLANAEALLGFEIHSALVDMHSLMFVPPPTKNVLPRIYHASLSDFLMDQSRAHKYYIGLSYGHARLCRRWLKFIGTLHQSQTIRMHDALDAFIHHCHESPVGELADALSSLDLRLSLGGTRFKQDLYRPRWDVFFACVRQQGGDRDDVFPRLQKDFDDFFLDCIGRYPLPLRTHIPILLCLLRKDGILEIFQVLFRGTTKSTEERGKFRNQDDKLFGILKTLVYGFEYSNDNQCITALLQDKARAGEYYVDGGSYATLAKVLVGLIYAKPGESNFRLSFSRINRNLLEEIFTNASIDLELAYLLRDRVLQGRNGIKRPDIAVASINYIKRCGIRFLQHTHQADIDTCAICDIYRGAVFVEEETGDDG